MTGITADSKIIQAILDFTKTRLEKCGSRVTGTKGCLAAADEISQMMRLFCDKVFEEPFTLYPGSLFNVARVISVCYVLAVFLLVLGGIYVYLSLALCSLALAYAIIHYFIYGEFFDRLFKKQSGCNAVGILDPVDTVKQQVIVVGHHDSSHVFNFLSRFQSLAGIRFFLAILFYLFITVTSLAAVLNSVFSGAAWQLRDLPLVFALIGFIFLLPLFFFLSTKVSPGAGDNLNGSSLAIHIGQYFANRKMNGLALYHTRLILLSTDGEEAGQRGAISYVRQHKQELTAMPTYVLNIDSIYNLKNLAILTRDRHGFWPLSAPLARECVEIASELGYHLKKMPAPFGSGTDAAAFAKEGVEATTLIGMPTSMFAKEYVYHTAGDTIESIEPEAVEAVFNIIINYIENSDQAL